MKDNLENFKQVSDEILKDIYVTDELERKTLEKCNSKSFFKLNPLIISTASAAALMVAFGIYNHFSHNTNVNVADNSMKHEYKNTTKENKDFPKIVENKKMDNSKDLALNNEKKDNTAVQNKSLNSKSVAENTNINAANGNTSTNSSIKNTNSNTDVKNANTVSQSPSDPENKNLNTSENTSKSKTNNEDTNDKSTNVRFALIPLEASLSIKEAEKYFQSKILIPSYIPEGFSLTNISIPDHNVKCVKLRYSSDSSYFEILQSKKLYNLKENKIISIGNNKAYVSSSEDENNIDTKISWISGDIQYSLCGNLPESSLIDISKSIK